MELRRDIDIDTIYIIENLDRITNQIFKLLPLREEGSDWQAPLETLIIEVCGLSKLLKEQSDLLSLLCKMEGMMSLTEETEFLIFRKTVFECLGIITKIKSCLD